MKLRIKRVDILPVAISFLIAVVTTFIIVFKIGEKSFFKEVEISIGIIAFILFLIMSVGLYLGYGIKRVRFKDWREQIVEYFKTRKSKVDLSDFGDITGVADDGIIGGIISVIIAIITTIAMVFLLILFIEYLFGIMIGVVFLINFIMYIALKKVLKYSIICKGNVIKSVLYSIKYTILYSGWIFIFILIINAKTK